MWESLAYILNFSSVALQTADMWIILLVPFFVIREAEALVTNDPIMLGTLIWSFRQLEHQNPSSNG